MSQLALIPRSPGEVDSTDAQCTPRDLALALGSFDLDPCTNPRSHIQARRTCMLEHGQDGLAEVWSGSVFCNGPFSDPLPWCERLRAHRDPWCSLWKLDPTTAWWTQLMLAGASWAPFRKRLRFEKPGNVGGAEFPCALVWRDWEPPLAALSWLWEPRREFDTQTMAAIRASEELDAIGGSYAERTRP